MVADIVTSHHEFSLAVLRLVSTPAVRMPTQARAWHPGVTGQEFVRGFLQHTLPPNLQRIRYYGFLNRHSSLSIDYVRMLVWFYLGWCCVLQRKTVPEEPVKRPMRCSECGGNLQLVAITDQHGRVVYNRPLPDHSVSYLDSS